MKKIAILMIGLIVISLGLNKGVLAEEVIYETPGTRNEDVTLIILAILLVFTVIVICSAYAMHTHSQRVHDRYELELERLDKQLRDKVISEETYKELKRDLEKKYKWYG